MEPWEKIKQQNYKAGYRNMAKKTFRMPDNSLTDYDIVNMDRVVAILAVTQNKEIILVKQFRPGPEKVLNDLPGGMIEVGENQQEAAERELLEETGYKGQLHFVGESFECAYSGLIRYNYVALNCKKVRGLELDKHEYIEVITCDIEAYKKLLRSGQISDLGPAYLMLDFLENKLHQSWS